MLNQVNLIGRAGMDPLSRDGAVVFRLATHETVILDGSSQEETEWHSIVAFGKQAQTLAKHLKKGRLLHVTGKLRTRVWTKDGATVRSTEVVVASFSFLDKPAAAPGAPPERDYGTGVDDGCPW